MADETEWILGQPVAGQDADEVEWILGQPAYRDSDAAPPSDIVILRRRRESA